MSSFEYLKEFVNERLTAAAEEIFGVFKRTIDEYEEELVRLHKMLPDVRTLEIKLLRTEPPQEVKEEEENLTGQQLWSQNSAHQNLEEPQVKEEPEEQEEQEEEGVHAGDEELLKQEAHGIVTDQKNDNSDCQSLNWNRDGAEPTTSNVCLPAPVGTHPVDRTFKCDVCEKDFRSKADCQKHLRTHTGEKPYSCSFCSKNFSQRSSLNLHLRIHSGEKPYVCETCGKDFIQRSDLTIHIRRAHTGEKPYRCEICGKCFPANNDLSVHLKIHMGHKQFTCATCGRGFRRGCQLTMHIRREHIGEKRFICQICDKRYFNTYELSRHQRSHMKSTDFHTNKT